MESICIVVVQERTQKEDIISHVSISVDSRLTPALDTLIDRDTQLLFDQDNVNPYEYKASLVDKVLMIGILSCIRSSGWDWGTSNGYIEDGTTVKNFYFEKKIDLAKAKPAAIASKQAVPKMPHLGAITTSIDSSGRRDVTEDGTNTPPPLNGSVTTPTCCPSERQSSPVHDTNTADPQCPSRTIPLHTHTQTDSGSKEVNKALKQESHEMLVSSRGKPNE